ncbi:MAG: STAS domain-containing protein [Cocleimonas sp.]
MAQIIKSQQGIQLSGDFVFSQVATLLEQAKNVLGSQSESKLILSCEEITRIDSAGISLFLELKRWSSKQNKTLSIQGLPKQAQSLVDTYKLQDVIT